MVSLVKLEEASELMDHGLLLMSYILILFLLQTLFQHGQAVILKTVGHLAHVLELLHQVLKMLQVLKGF